MNQISTVCLGEDRLGHWTLLHRWKEDYSIIRVENTDYLENPRMQKLRTKMICAGIIKEGKGISLAVYPLKSHVVVIQDFNLSTWGGRG